MYFFDIVTKQNGPPRYVKIFLGHIYVFFTSSTRGGVFQGIGAQLACAIFHLGQLKNEGFRNSFFFNIVSTQNDHPRYVTHVLGSMYVGVKLAMVAGGWWVENRGRPPPPLDTAGRGWGVNCAEAPCGQKY